MKKILIFITTIILLTGCSLMGSSPKAKVEEYLNSYQNLSDIVLAELDNNTEMNNYSDTQKTKYKDILKKQYKDLKYKVTEEVINGDEATVTANITVYDLYKVQKDATSYQTLNPDKFLDSNGTYNQNSFLDYRLEQMTKVTDTTSYTISFNLTKTDNKWVINNIDDTILQKIHGIYNYET